MKTLILKCEYINYRSSLAELPKGMIFLSKPHFYGHKSLFTNVNFKPNFHQHESTIYFEPLSGTPIRAQLRIQLSANVLIDRLQLNQDGSTQYEFIFF